MTVELLRPDDRLVVDALTRLDHPIKTEVAEWAREHLGGDDLIARDKTSTFFEKGWRACAERGLAGALVPERFASGLPRPIAELHVAVGWRKAGRGTGRLGDAGEQCGAAVVTGPSG